MARMPVARAQQARAQTIRLFELAFVLLSARQPVSREQIMGLVSDYRGADEAARVRMFERDKADLRELGLELETTPSPDDGQDRYRVTSRSYELPELDFTLEERAVLVLAGRVWGEQALADDSQEALVKLAAAGITLDESPSMAFQPSLSAREQCFHPLWDATTRRRRVRFSYRAGSGVVTERHVEPWVLGSRSGHWYLIGLDLDRDAKRSFKLTRVVGQPVAEGPDHAYEVPADIDRRSLLASLAPARGTEVAILAIRSGHAPSLRRTGRPTDHDLVPEGYEGVEVTFTSPEETAFDLAMHGADVLVLEPDSLRSAVMDHLRRVVTTHGEGER